MKLEDVKEAPKVDRPVAASASEGNITIMGANGIRVCIPVEGLRMDPVTGEIDRACWGVDSRAAVGMLQLQSRRRHHHWRDSHMGGVEL